MKKRKKKKKKKAISPPQHNLLYSNIYISWERKEKRQRGNRIIPEGGRRKKKEGRASVHLPLFSISFLHLQREKGKGADDSYTNGQEKKEGSRSFLYTDLKKRGKKGWCRRLRTWGEGGKKKKRKKKIFGSLPHLYLGRGRYQVLNIKGERIMGERRERRQLARILFFFSGRGRKRKAAAHPLRLEE